MDLLAQSCEPLTKTQIKELKRLSKAKRRSPDQGINPFVVEGLTEDEAANLAKSSLTARQSILGDFGKIHAWFNPWTGYALIENVVRCIQRMPNKDDLVEALELQEFPNDEMKHHSRRDYVEKMHNAVMEFVHKGGEHQQPHRDGTNNKKSPPKTNTGGIVAFKTFWADGFLLHRGFVHGCARNEGIGHKKAVVAMHVAGPPAVAAIAPSALDACALAPQMTGLDVVCHPDKKQEKKA